MNPTLIKFGERSKSTLDHEAIPQTTLVMNSFKGNNKVGKSMNFENQSIMKLIKDQTTKDNSGQISRTPRSSWRLPGAPRGS